MKRLLVRVGLALPIVLLACSELFEEPSQCKTDRDCERFNAVCDVARSVCVTGTPGGGGEGGTDFDANTNPDPNDSSTVQPEASKNCSGANKPTMPIGMKVDGGDGGTGEITGNVTLGCENDWTLEGHVFVRSGATLTIEAGTTIRAKKDTNAALVVAPGARLIAQGSKELPIVITSDAAVPVAGDWRGLFILGVAPPAARAPFEDDPRLGWGGANADDDSGILQYVRVEYARNGLVLAGVGRKTKIDFVQVRKTIDNCFFFYGGTADAKHLVCQYPGDEQLETLEGYAGRIQFIFAQKTPAGPNVFNRNGLLLDDSKPVIYNATIVGDTAPNFGYGLIFRYGVSMQVGNALFTGWYGGVDAVGDVTAVNELRGSIMFANATNPAYAENGAEQDPNSPVFDDDNGFDELAWFGAQGRGNVTTAPALMDPHSAKNPRPWPNGAITVNARNPPNDGFFDSTASYIGAFKDNQDMWIKGAWTRFDDK